MFSVPLNLIKLNVFVPQALRRVKKQKQTVEEELVLAMEGNQRLYSDLSSAYRNVRVVVDKLNGCVNEKERLITGLNVKVAEVSQSRVHHVNKWFVVSIHVCDVNQ